MDKNNYSSIKSKNYKRFLDPNIKKEDISSKTVKRWEEIVKAGTESNENEFCNSSVFIVNGNNCDYNNDINIKKKKYRNSKNVEIDRFYSNLSDDNEAVAMGISEKIIKESSGKDSDVHSSSDSTYSYQYNYNSKQNLLGNDDLTTIDVFNSENQYIHDVEDTTITSRSSRICNDLETDQYGNCIISIEIDRSDEDVIRTNKNTMCNISGPEEDDNRILILNSRNDSCDQDLTNSSSSSSTIYVSELEEYDNQISIFDSENDSVYSEDHVAMCSGTDAVHNVDELEEHDTRIMFKESQTSVYEVSVILRALSTKYHLSDTAIQEFGNLIKLLGPKTFNHSSLFNRYNLFKKLSIPDDVVKYYFYCKFCEENILYIATNKSFKKCTKVCSNCQKEQDVSFKDYRYFIYIDINYQFVQLLQSKRLRKFLINNCKRGKDKKMDKNGSKIISRISDGDLYENLLINKDCCIVSVSVNTDGAPIFDNSKTFMWPVQLRINELSPVDYSNNVILSGFLLVDTEPSAKLLNLYLDIVLVKNIERLSTVGINIYDEEKEIKFKMFVLLVTVDSKARPLIQNRIQFNGYWGCSWCYAQGKYTNTIRYPYRFCYSNIRTKYTHKNDVKEVISKRTKSVKGVKGKSSLMKLLHFDTIWGYPVDLLHAICLGVTKQFWDNWTERNSPFYINARNIKMINRKLLKCTFPSEIHRDCRPFEKRIKKKASEWFTWLLYVSIICLQDVLPYEALHHFSILVKCIYTLSKSEVTERECLMCHKQLITFLEQCEIFYGTDFLTFNIHSLSHLAYSIKKSGPLLNTSTFPAESFMYQLQQCKTSSKGLDKQIVRRFLQMNFIKYTELSHLAPNKDTTNFLENILFKKSNNLNDNEGILLSHAEHRDGLQIYMRCIYLKTIYTSQSYCDKMKKNNSAVQLKNKRIVQIQYFFRKEHNVYLKAKIIKINQELLDLQHVYKIRITNEEIIENISCILCKCIFINISKDEKYICFMSNKLEVQ